MKCGAQMQLALVLWGAHKNACFGIYRSALIIVQLASVLQSAQKCLLILPRRNTATSALQVAQKRLPRQQQVHPQNYPFARSRYPPAVASPTAAAVEAARARDARDTLQARCSPLHDYAMRRQQSSQEVRRQQGQPRGEPLQFGLAPRMMMHAAAPSCTQAACAAAGHVPAAACSG